MLKRLPIFQLLLIINLVVLIVLSGCSKSGKLSRSKDLADREKAAMILYAKKDYERASFIIEELLSVFKGTPKAEDMLYLYAQCKFNLKDYLTAAYYFNDFSSQYPLSSRAEECQFMYALCFYQDSDPWYLDQSSSRRSIESIQLYLKANPGTKRVDSCNLIINEMREKLAKKSFEQANLYHKIGHHKSAIEAFRQTMEEYPDSKYREESQYRQFLSSYQYAEISVPEKQKNRYLEAMAYYRKFADKYPLSRYLREAEVYYTKAVKSLEKIESKGSTS
jgi:outer membrane protein assembly factor BamD